ncbi:hypothetical protein CTheo_5392 [Ceratobasidium theobromae]|uniref:Cyanovirin-N domain-containing protein n=1 Tax=Ceratobasidium theobromae TaxID=1582974 RepID=A0A5N5QI16_9AGAM|nr:hypothetical protein CTheo_5392 [Ceratobasidium theobromae]
MHFTSFLTLVGASLFAASGVQAANFGSTCSNIYLSGTTLTATCTKVKGSPTTTSLDLNNCIINNQGIPLCKVGGNFAASCSGCYLDSSVYTQMWCTCNGGVGPHSASIVLNNCVSNLDGVLSCP